MMPPCAAAGTGEMGAIPVEQPADHRRPSPCSCCRSAAGLAITRWPTTVPVADAPLEIILADSIEDVPGLDP